MNAQSINYRYAAEQLNEILVKYSHCDDILSKHILYWGEGVREAARDHRNDSDEIIAKIAQEKIQELSSEILVNPIDNAPLKDPVLERRWTWERWMYEEYRRVLPESPLDNEPWESPVPHLFAQEMIGWAYSLTSSCALTVFDDAKGRLDEKQIALLGRDKDPECAVAYTLLAQNAVERESKRALCEKVKNTLVLVDRFMKKMTIKDHEATEAAEIKALEHRAALQERIDVPEQPHKEKLEELRALKESVIKDHEEKNAILDQKMELVDQKASAAIDGIKGKIAASDTDFREKVHGLDEERESAIQENQVKSVELTAKLTKTAEGAKEVIDALKESHQGAAAQVEKQIQEKKAVVQDLKERLKVKDAKDLDNTMAIGGLKARLSNFQGERETLRYQIDNIGGGCSIM